MSVVGKSTFSQQDWLPIDLHIASMQEKRSFFARFTFCRIILHIERYPSRNGRKDRNLTVYPNACVCVRMCKHTRECPVLISRWWISLSLVVCRDIACIFWSIRRGYYAVKFLSAFFFRSSFLYRPARCCFCEAKRTWPCCIRSCWYYRDVNLLKMSSIARRKSKPPSSRNSNIGIVECFMLTQSFAIDTKLILVKFIRRSHFPLLFRFSILTLFNNKEYCLQKLCISKRKKVCLKL